MPLIGSQPLDYENIFSNPNSLDAEIFFNIRLPRVLFAFLVGASLSVVGAVFQAILRNDLATPYTLGVSSGGAFGAVLALKLNLIFSFFVFSAVSLFSITGSLVAIGIIYAISKKQNGISMYTLILSGVAISFFFSAFNLFLHYMADFTETFRMVRWLMGSLDVNGWKYTISLMVILTVVFLYFFRNYKAYNILLAGDEVALSKGVEVYRLQKISFLIGSLIVGFIVAIAGPIGFVGLVVPHITRLLFGSDHKYVFSGSLIGGGVFLAVCDTFARTIISPAELPVGVITALLGGPFFIYLLIRKK
ncbi:MAG: iron ABC transporter permease [Calditrichaeota bacterium]|nr:MAG: iron ABC transporter permease [Calditrichota bacterium]MBL1206089.1 iron ABC transporter permease [Calditrichota bacterium]NOG45915.1 iron ABC transporter permease [Calditrichota bacterium]